MTTPANPFSQYNSKHLFDAIRGNPNFISLVNRLAGTTDISEWDIRYNDDLPTGSSYSIQRNAVEIYLPYGHLYVKMYVRRPWYAGKTGSLCASVGIELPPVPVRTTWAENGIVHSDGRTRSIVNEAETVDDAGFENGKFVKKFISATKALQKAIDELSGPTGEAIVDIALKRAKDCASGKEKMPYVYQTLKASGHFNDKQIETMRHLFIDAGLL